MSQHFFRNPEGAVIGVAGPHVANAIAAGYTEVDGATARTETPELFAAEIGGTR